MVIESQLDQALQRKQAIRRMLIPCFVILLIAFIFYLYASKVLVGGMGPQELKLYLKYFSIPFIFFIAIVVVQKSLRGTATSVKFSFYPERFDVEYDGVQTAKGYSYNYDDVKKLYSSKNVLSINPVFKLIGEAPIDFTSTEDLKSVEKAIRKHCPQLN